MLSHIPPQYIDAYREAYREAFLAGHTLAELTDTELAALLGLQAYLVRESATTCLLLPGADSGIDHYHATAAEVMRRLAGRHKSSHLLEVIDLLPADERRLSLARRILATTPQGTRAEVAYLRAYHLTYSHMLQRHGLTVALPVKGCTTVEAIIQRWHTELNTDGVWAHLTPEERTQRCSIVQFSLAYPHKSLLCRNPHTLLIDNLPVDLTLSLTDQRYIHTLANTRFDQFDSHTHHIFTTLSHLTPTTLTQRLHRHLALAYTPRHHLTPHSDEYLLHTESL